jgi:RHS repeat-associated protein
MRILFRLHDYAHSAYIDRSFAVSGVINTGERHYIAGVYDGGTTGDSITFYKDGAYIATTKADSGAYVSMENLSSSLRIGAAPAIWTANRFNGILDDVMLFKRALSADEIKFQYRNQSEADNELTWDEEEQIPPQANNPPALLGNPYMFTGRAFDLETGLYYYRARYYNPYLGRFLQTDPACQGMNWYAYCWNNPVNYIDSSGLQYPIPLPDLSWISPDVPFKWRMSLNGLDLFGDKGGAPPYPVADGQKWTINNFFNWYRYAPNDPEREGWGAPVDITNIGLLEDFQNNAAVRDNIANTQTTAKIIGMAMAVGLELVLKQA